MTYQKVVGTFKQRGDESTKNIPTLVEFAQEHLISDIMNVGSAGTDWVSVVTYITLDNPISQLQMVKRNTYEFKDFQSEEELKAFNHLTNNVQQFVGAYSHKYNV